MDRRLVGLKLEDGVGRRDEAGDAAELDELEGAWRVANGLALNLALDAASK